MEMKFLKQSNAEYLIPVEKVRFEGHGKSESRVQIGSGSGGEGRGWSSELVISLKALHKCVSSLSGSKGNAP